MPHKNSSPTKKSKFIKTKNISNNLCNIASKLDTKAVFGSCKKFSRKYLFSRNAIFQKGKYLQVFGCILKNALENIF